MKAATQRTLARCLHLLCGIPVVGYIYSPFALIPGYAPATRFLFVPLMLLSGLWMWKGQVVLKALSARAGDGRPGKAPGM